MATKSPTKQSPFATIAVNIAPRFLEDSVTDSLSDQFHGDLDHRFVSWDDPPVVGDVLALDSKRAPVGEVQRRALALIASLSGKLGQARHTG